MLTLQIEEDFGSFAGPTISIKKSSNLNGMDDSELNSSIYSAFRGDTSNQSSVLSMQNDDMIGTEV